MYVRAQCNELSAFAAMGSGVTHHCAAPKAQSKIVTPTPVHSAAWNAAWSRRNSRGFSIGRVLDALFIEDHEVPVDLGVASNLLLEVRRSGSVNLKGMDFRHPRQAFDISLVSNFP